MSAPVPAVIDNIKRNVVSLKMPRALEILDVTVRGIERGEMTALEAINVLLTEELTLRENRRDELTRLWTKDVKVAPWTGTAFGVVQAVNTYRTWEGIVRRVEGGRLERNFTSDVTGANADEDNKVIEDLAQVLGRKVTLALA